MRTGKPITKIKVEFKSIVASISKPLSLIKTEQSVQQLIDIYKEKHDGKKILSLFGCLLYLFFRLGRLFLFVSSF